jgi:hypothetical protein
MKQPVYFFWKLFILFILLAGIDWISAPVFNFVLNKLPDGRYYKIKYILEKSDEDVIVVGSSKAESNFVPSIISDKTGLKCFNAGRGGQSIPYSLSVTEAIFTRYSPRYIILNVDPYMLEDEVNYERLSILYPFYKKHKEIQPIINQKNRFEPIKLYSNLYAYNSALFYFFRPFFLPNRDGMPSEKGWKPLYRQMGDLNYQQDSIQVDDSKVNLSSLNNHKKEMFLSIVKLCQQHNTQLMLVVCPEFTFRKKQTATLQYITDFSRGNNIVYLDYSRDSSFVGKSLFFADVLHLNNKGADRFTNYLMDKFRLVNENKLITFK